MECVCGCGRKLGRSLADANFVAASVALELLAWDKNRQVRPLGHAGREVLIERGAQLYQGALAHLHGEGPDVGEECRLWVNESGHMREEFTDLTERRLVGGGAPNLSKEDMARLDRTRPEASFTGPVPNEKLARLQALRDEDVLTEEEFEAARARLLADQ
jgi:hypothetical protein